jgi:hypothetical protein
MRKAALASILALLAMACFGQGGPKYRVLLGLDSASSLDAGKCGEALSAAISRSPLVGEVRIWPGGQDISEEAGKLGFDLALSVSILPAVGGVRLWWRVFGASSGDEVGRGAFDAAIPDARDLQDVFWLDILTSLETAIAAVARPGEVRLLVSGPPGAMVKGFGKDPIELSAEGEAELRVAAPATYPWSASARGYDSVEGLAAVFGQEPYRLDLPMPRQFRWTIDAGLFNGAFLDAWASYRFMNDSLFLRAGYRQYLVGLSLREESPGAEAPVLVSFPLLQIGLGGGALFGEPGRPLRTYAGVLATTRIALPRGAGVFIDPVAPLCLEPFGGLEWRPVSKWGFFGELYAGLYLFADGLLFAASMNEDNRFPSFYAIGDGWVFCFPNLRFGARLYL